jgi:ABC-type uncharacterized transport system permease subunit
MRKLGGLKVRPIFRNGPPGGRVEWTRLMTDYEHTSLKPYVEMFEKHVAAVLRDSRMVKKGKCLFGLLVGIVLTFSIEGGEYGFLGIFCFCCMHSCCIQP